MQLLVVTRVEPQLNISSFPDAVEFGIRLTEAQPIGSQKPLISKVEWLVATVSGLALTLTRGVDFGVNQFQYLLFGLRLRDAQFLPGDWFTWETHHHHFAFGYLTWLLNAVGPLELTLLLSQAVTLVIFCAGLLVLSKNVTDHGRLTFGLVLLVVVLYPSELDGLGGFFLLSNYLQPSQVSGPLLMLGLGALFARRWMLAGVLIAVGGVFHGSFLVSFFPVACLQALACGVWCRKRDIVAFLGPLVLAGLVFIVLVAYSGGIGEADAESMRIMTHFRSPHHYVVSSWIQFSGVWLLLWIAWTVLAILALVSDPRRGWFDPMVVSFGAAALITSGSVMQAYLENWPALTSLGLWRVAPWVHYLSLVLVAGRLLDLMLNKGVGAWQMLDVAFVILLLTFVLIWAGTEWQGLLVLFPAVFLWKLDWRERHAADKAHSKSAQQIVLVFIAVLVTGAALVGGVRNSFNDMQSPVASKSLSSLQRWVLDRTPANAVFVVPPDLQMFRLMMRRPIVVDLKSTPYHPGDLRIWYQRMLDVTGIERSSTVGEIHAGYARLDVSRARLLRNQYGATHFVVRHRYHQGGLKGMLVHFQNDDFLVLSLPD
ncbi:DUF6798 domain-containing protein [Pseudomonadota bacterium]